MYHTTNVIYIAHKINITTLTGKINNGVTGQEDIIAFGSKINFFFEQKLVFLDN